MRYWEFLIQQEGDQTWLPLETRQVEILEGRYRMAAHTSYDSKPAEIRVSQLLLDEIPPRRRVRKRKANTSDSGLLAIFPFIQLSPGQWEIECNSPDVIDDFLGEGGWHYSVQLQVAPRDEDDWDPDWSEAATDLSQAQPLDTDEWSAKPQTAADDTADGGPDSPPDRATDTATTDTTTDSSANFELQLKQQAYVTQMGQPFSLAGQLSQLTGAPLANGQLWVELRDPQTASTVKEMVFAVPNHPLPSPFSVTITLPDNLSTQVILGAISLVDRSQDKTVLASASFTVTLGLAQMLDAIANQPNLDFEEEISIFPGSTEAFVPPTEKAEALLTSDTPIIPKEIIPSEGLTLPPQLKPPSDVDPNRQPELPTFPDQTDQAQTDSAAPAKRSPNAPEPATAEPAETTAEPIEIAPEPADSILDQADIDEFEFDPPDVTLADITPADIDPADLDAADIEPTGIDPESHTASATDQPVAPQPVEPPPTFAPSNSIEDDDLDLELATAALDEPPTEKYQPLSPGPLPLPRNPATDFSRRPTKKPRWQQTPDTIDQSFEKLQLRERFWQKLSLFTQDGYRQSLEVKRALHPTQPPLQGNNRQSNEFVAYEPPRRSRWSDQREKQEVADPIQVMPPILDVPHQELVAGEWLAIKVRIPAGDYQPYVKVWMNDLQTRTVIDAPRLLMQFIPNDNHELETLMRIQIPKGCLELQFAAISIDMATLQESRKVVQNRRVMPPDNSLAVFDEWDI